jgi:quercetin dioxygenase-like cupin family protein
MYALVLASTTQTLTQRLGRHGAHALVAALVLSGRMRLLLGEDDLVIEPGEAVEFSTWTPHWFGAIDAPVQALAIFGPNGERVHLHS